MARGQAGMPRSRCRRSGTFRRLRIGKVKASDVLQREPFVPLGSRGTTKRRASAAVHALAPQIVINGRFLEQAVTGVQRVAREITCEIDAMIGERGPAVEVSLLHPPSVNADELCLRNIRAKAVGRLRGAAWEQFELPVAVAGRPLLCLGNSAPVISLLAGRRVGVMIHDLSYLDFPLAYRRLYRWSHRALLPLLLSHASKLFLVSQTERERLLDIRADTAARIVVAPNGGWIDRPAAAAARSAAASLPDNYVLFTGSLSYRKNVDRMLQAAIRLAREDSVSFVFAGSFGTVLTRPSIAIPPDLESRIVFVGQVDDRHALGRLYQNARLLLFPSLYEASPLPPFEAAHFGVPVVASNIPSMWERCDDGVAYCDPRSADSIVATVRRVLADPAERRRLVRINRARAAQASWRDQARTVLSAMIGQDAGNRC